MFAKENGERAALALLEYVEAHKELSYVLIDPLRYAAMSSAIHAASSSEVIGQSKKVLGMEVTPRFKKVMLADFDRVSTIALAHSDVQSFREGKLPKKRTVAEDVEVYIPIAFDSNNTSSINDFKRHLNNFFSAQPVEEYEIRPKRSTETSRVITMTYEQLDFLREWAKERGEVKGWRGMKGKIAGKLTPDLSNVLRAPQHEKDIETEVAKPATEAEPPNIEALVAAGKLVTAAQLDSRRQAKRAEATKGADNTERR